MDVKEIRKWIVSTVGAALGGGLASSIAALSDPTKYRFPQDLGTGKMWPFFLTGAGLTLGGMILHSPFGQKLMGTYRTTQAQLIQDQKDIAQAKVDLKSAGLPPAKSPDKS